MTEEYLTIENSQPASSSSPKQSRIRWHWKHRNHMIQPSNLLAEALTVILKPIVIEAVREAMKLYSPEVMSAELTGKSFLTVKQAAETSGLGVSTIRLYIRRRQLRAQQVGRRVLIKRNDLESFLEGYPIEIQPDKTSP